MPHNSTIMEKKGSTQPMTRRSKEARQMAWLHAYKAKMFNISAACRETKIDRSTYYHWLENQDFAQAVGDAREAKIDIIEAELFKKVKAGDVTAIIFALKTLGKSRGYIERKELSGPEGEPLPAPDIKILLKNPEVRIALETVAKKARDAKRKTLPRNT
jgi:hypothetical protein